MRAMLTTSCVGLSAHALAIQQRIQYNWKTLVIPLFLIFLTVFAGPINGALTQTHELQVPGATETYFRPAQNFCLSGFGTPCLQEFFEQKYAVAFMVTQGDSSNCHLKWCNDSGANRHISGDLSDFKPDTVRSVNIQITVAKAGVSMQATAIGDCDLHTLDNMGRPCVISCKDTLFVPGVAKNLLSSHCLGQMGYQAVSPSITPNFPPGLYLPPRKDARPRYVAFQVVHNLCYISTRNDLHDQSGRMLTRGNKYIVAHRKLGFMPMSALKQTKDCVIGLEGLADSHFPGNHYSDDAVKVGKLHHVDLPPANGTRAARPMACIHWDTMGPTRSRSCQGCSYVTIFTCDYSGYTFSYGHQSTAQMPALLERLLADTRPLQEKHGPILSVRRDNASVNVSKELMTILDQRGIRSETSNPYEAWQNGKPERMFQTVTSTARTVLLTSGLDGRFWLHAFQYAVRIHNIQYSRILKTSPYVAMHGVKPDISDDQQFGVEAWMYIRPEQRKDPKFSARGEPCIFVGYPTNQQGFLVWCPSRGNNTIVSTTNVVFGTLCPRAKRPEIELLPDSAKDVFLQETPTALRLEEVHAAHDLCFVGTWEDQFVLTSSYLDSPRSLKPSEVMSLLSYTHENNLASAHLSLVDSYALIAAELPAEACMQEVIQSKTVPKTVTQALSPEFHAEWSKAMDSELAGFVKHGCFEALPSLTEGVRTLPGSWLFSRKRDGTAKARYVMGGHRQRLGQDYFEHKNYCAVLASRDNRLLLALAAAQGWQVHQTDIQQAFLHGILDDVDIYTMPPDRYPCPAGYVLKLRKAIYGLHQAPPKFKKEVTEWLRAQGCKPANDSETVWIQRTDKGVLVHALYADDFLHFTDNSAMYQSFQKQFKKRFDIKTGSELVYLGNQIVVDAEKFNVTLDQTQYIDDLLARFEMDKSTPVATAMVERLSESNRGNSLSKDEQARYRVIVESLIYLSCWSRPDISFAVSELSRFVSGPGEVHMVAAKHLLRYIKGTRDLRLSYSRRCPTDKLNLLWGFVDSDWAGCPDSRKSTSGYALMLNGAAIAWKSKRQSVVALSSAEAEFVAASSLVHEVIYIRRLLENLGFPQSEPTAILEDNRTCIAWSEGSVGGSDRAKHIDLRQHFVHDAVHAKVLKLEVVRSADNVADIFTKPLPKTPFLVLRKQLMGF